MRRFVQGDGKDLDTCPDEQAGDHVNRPSAGFYRERRCAQDQPILHRKRHCAPEVIDIAQFTGESYGAGAVETRKRNVRRDLVQFRLVRYHGCPQPAPIV
jgi:hypothetical protein